MGKLLTCLPDSRFCREAVSTSIPAARSRQRLPRSTGIQLSMCVLTLQTSHRPNGKLTFCSLLAGRWCLCRGWLSDHLIVHHQWEHRWLCCARCAHAQKFPMPQWETHVLLVVCIGRRCLRLFWHGLDNVFLDHRQHSFLCACSHSKSPIAPIGKLLTCLPRLTLAQLRTLWSSTGCTCHRDLQKFPSPPWETHVWLVAYRAVVSQSSEAQ
jgi:hypothetical protein